MSTVTREAVKEKMIEDLRGYFVVLSDVYESSYEILEYDYRSLGIEGTIHLINAVVKVTSKNGVQVKIVEAMFENGKTTVRIQPLTQSMVNIISEFRTNEDELQKAV